MEVVFQSLDRAEGLGLNGAYTLKATSLRSEALDYRGQIHTHLGSLEDACRDLSRAHTIAEDRVKPFIAERIAIVEPLYRAIVTEEVEAAQSTAEFVNVGEETVVTEEA